LSGGEAIPSVIATDHVFRGRMIGLRVDTLETAEGDRYTREVVEYGVAVVLVPVDAGGRILMVRQYRHPAGKWLLELPAGGMDDDDASPEEAAQRELREETGFRGKLTRIGGLYLAPGYSEEYQHVYAATDLVEDPLDADDDEDLRLESVSVDEAIRYVGEERICDAKTIAALFMYLRHAGRI
jgi:8-oxo-dGTP pyrophosphatase MutT (NUDIX family)